MAYSYNVDEYITEHRKISAYILSEDSIFDKIEKKFLREFEDNGLTAEMLGQFKIQFYIQSYAEIEKQASGVTIQILDTGIESGKKEQEFKLAEEQVNTGKSETALIDAKKLLVDREELGFNDNLKVKKAEFLGNVASMAINSDSYDEGDAVTKFNAAIQALI